MFTFTLRDTLWATLFIGFGLHAWIDRSATYATYLKRVREETAERADADHRAQVAEELADRANAKAARFAALARQLQIEANLRELAGPDSKSAASPFCW
jgi:hypothetical protein